MDNTALKRWLVLGGLLSLTLYLVWNSPGPETQPMATVESSRVATATPSPEIARQAAARQAMLRPLAQAEGDFRFVPRPPVTGEVVDIFAPAVAKRPQADIERVVKEVAPAPQAPPVPFTFVGKMAEGDGVKVFLQANDVLYTVKVGDTFAQQYKLMGADNGKLSLLYLPLNITQTMFYGEGFMGSRLE
jgi:hypothetical protein